MKNVLSALAICLATSTAAFDMEAMTDAERQTFRDEIRAYLLDNPEVLMEAIGVLEAREQQAQVANDVELARTNLDALHNDGHSLVWGNPEGDITMVEFMDYRCGFCRRAHPEIAELIETDGNIRIITKEYPILGEQSVVAARFAVATKIVAGDEAYKNISDALMTMRADVSEDSLTRLAETFALDTDAIIATMSSDEVTAVLEENRLLGQRMNISGTPTFVVEDQMLRGYLPLDQMQQIVAQIRDEG